MNSPEIHPITAQTVVPFPCWCYYEPDRRWDFINLKAMSSMYDTHYCTSDTMPTTAPLSEPTVKESLSVETPPPEGEEATSGDFLGYGEPIGSVVKHYPCSTARERLARSFFERELFTYFSELSSGQTGWGICYNGWLKIHGWELIGFATFKRVQSVEEEIATSALPPHDGEPTEQPRRRVVLKLEIGADDREELVQALDQIIMELNMGRLRGESCSGGVGSGWAMTITEDETITHESYFAALLAMRQREGKK